MRLAIHLGEFVIDALAVVVGQGCRRRFRQVLRHRKARIQRHGVIALVGSDIDFLHRDIAVVFNSNADLGGPIGGHRRFRVLTRIGLPQEKPCQGCG